MTGLCSPPEGHLGRDRRLITFHADDDAVSNIASSAGTDEISDRRLWEQALGPSSPEVQVSAAIPVLHVRGVSHYAFDGRSAYSLYAKGRKMWGFACADGCFAADQANVAHYLADDLWPSLASAIGADLVGKQQRGGGTGTAARGGHGGAGRRMSAMPTRSLVLDVRESVFASGPMSTLTALFAEALKLAVVNVSPRHLAHPAGSLPKEGYGDLYGAEQAAPWTCFDEVHLVAGCANNDCRSGGSAKDLSWLRMLPGGGASSLPSAVRAATDAAVGDESLAFAEQGSTDFEALLAPFTTNASREFVTVVSPTQGVIRLRAPQPTPPGSPAPPQSAGTPKDRGAASGSGETRPMAPGIPARRLIAGFRRALRQMMANVPEATDDVASENNTAVIKAGLDLHAAASQRAHSLRKVPPQLGASTSQSSHHQPRSRFVVATGREDATTHRIVNIAEVYRAIERSDATLHAVPSFARLPLVEAVRLIGRADLFLSPHGSTVAANIFFMRAGAVLAEVWWGHTTHKGMAQALSPHERRLCYLGTTESAPHSFGYDYRGRDASFFVSKGWTEVLEIRYECIVASTVKRVGQSTSVDMAVDIDSLSAWLRADWLADTPQPPDPALAQ